MVSETYQTYILVIICAIFTNTGNARNIVSKRSADDEGNQTLFRIFLSCQYLSNVK